MASEHSYSIGDKPNRGMSIVINIQKFPDETKYRHGSEHDVQKLKNIFADLLGFTFMSFTNLTASSVRQLLKAVAKVDCNEHQCFILAMLSHGDTTSIQCSDGETLDFDEIYASFSARNSPTLAGKPKIFIIQCCRGERFNMMQTHRRARGRIASDHTALPDAPSTPHEKCVPESCDIIAIHAASLGYKSFRDENDGSVFIEALSSTFDKYKTGIDLVTMITRMNETYSQKCFDFKDKEISQVATVESSLTLDLYLPPIQWGDNR